MGTKYLLLGGAGFLGSYLAKDCASSEPDAEIVIFDNFSSGRIWHLDGLEELPRVSVVTGDVKNLEELTDCMAGVEVVYHLASNPDIAAALTKPDIDFWEGTYLTQNVLEAMRVNEVKHLLYASGSGVYGDTGSLKVREDYSPMRPISTYGASKLAGEALICSYCHMFGLTAQAFRFANIVGAKQTHGVVYDFVQKLLANPLELPILGDGRQSKGYIHAEDAIAAMRTVQRRNLEGFSAFNVATDSELTVREIADIVVEVMGLENVRYAFKGGNRGWKGDVPIVRLDSQAIRAEGWECSHSAKEAIYRAARSILADADRHGFSRGPGLEAHSR